MKGLAMTVVFKTPDRSTPYLFPPAIDDWVAEGHLARFVVDIVEQLDLSIFEDSYRGTGSEPYHPSIMLELLFYGYATGIFASRKLEQATYDSVPFRYICRDYHPDHDTIAGFRKRFLKEIEECFKQILLIAHEMGQLKLGTISLDGTKIKANASKHKALSWQYANKLEQQIKDEIKKLLAMAESADKAVKENDLDIPEELRRRQDRLEKIAKAKAEIKARAKARYAEEQRLYDEKMKDRKEREEKSGKKSKTKGPKPPQAGPGNKDQVNLTDKESRIMPKSGGGFEQAYNAQASVDTASMLIVENHIAHNPNDKKEISPALEKISNLPDVLGKPDSILSDAGYYSESNVIECHRHNVIPYIVDKRDKHNNFLDKHFSEQAMPPENATRTEQMKYRMQTEEGKKVYAKRKSTVEPVFGIIKHVMGFKQFMLRSKNAVAGEWNIVCTAFNIKRLHRLTVST